MNLGLQHLRVLIQLKQWAPPSNQLNMPSIHPGILCDLCDEYKLIDRDDKSNWVLTPAGEAALNSAVCGMRSAARQAEVA